GLSSGANQIAVSGEVSCALLDSGGVKCWGEGYGSTPQNVPGLTSGVRQIALGGESPHGCALMTTGAVKCWGNNLSGELGNGTLTSSNSAVDVSGLSAGFVAVTAGASYSCALSDATTVMCWGQPDAALGIAVGLTPVDAIGSFLAVDALGPAVTVNSPTAS